MDLCHRDGGSHCMWQPNHRELLLPAFSTYWPSCCSELLHPTRPRIYGDSFEPPWGTSHCDHGKCWSRNWSRRRTSHRRGCHRQPPPDWLCTGTVATRFERRVDHWKRCWRIVHHINRGSALRVKATPRETIDTGIVATTLLLTVSITDTLFAVIVANVNLLFGRERQLLPRVRSHGYGGYRPKWKCQSWRQCYCLCWPHRANGPWGSICSCTPRSHCYRNCLRK